VVTDGTQLQDSSQLSPEELLRELVLQRSLNQQLSEQLATATRKLDQLEYRLQQVLKQLYGRSSEKIDPKQMALFSDLLKQIELQNAQSIDSNGAAAGATDSSTTDSPVLAVTRGGHGRKRLPEHLPRERVIHDLPEDEKPCPCCGVPRSVIGAETSEQLEFVPATVKVIEHVRLKYMCKSCEKNVAETGPQIVTAEKPLMPIEKGLAAPGLLAYVGVSKYDDSLPLYRLEKIFRRFGIDIPRSTQCGWVDQAAETMVPLVNLMIRDLLLSRVIHTDDTPVNVRDKKLDKTRQGRFWVYLGDGDHPQTVFDYTPSRSRDGPMNFLKHWGQQPQGAETIELEPRFLQADAFGGYDNIYKNYAGGPVIEVACWAHARRYFFNAQKTDRYNSAKALAHIKRLYDVERDARNLSPHERAQTRQERSAPLLADFRQWLTQLQIAHGGDVLPQSPMGKAITYAFNQWEALCVYLLHGELNIDNNASENALRRIAIGRNNWGVIGHDNGGRTAAILFSLIATCHRHQVEPFAYLRDVLTRIAAHPHSRLHELLPAQWKLANPTSDA